MSKCFTGETRGMRNAVLVFFLAALLAVSITGLVLFYFSGGFGGGMGHGAQMQYYLSYPFLWLWVFVVPLILAVVVVGYRVAFPEIKTEKPKQVEDTVVEDADAEEAEPVAQAQSLDAILHVLSEDERKVVETVASAGGEAMLQKDIRWKTGLSRVKVHRVIARLSQRGIVQVEKYYNTNKVALSDWLTKTGNKDAKAGKTGE
jgi:uncharacterized membrane protein